MGWQSTLETDPPKDKKFWAFTADFEYGRRHNAIQQEGWWSGTHYTCRTGQMITHWMLLPDAPRDK